MIYVLGGSGFIGTRLCARLKKSFKIIDKKASTSFASRFEFGDVTKLSGLVNCLDSNGAIINLAAEHHDNVYPKSLYYEVNVLGAKNVCEVAKSRGINTIVFTSSVAVYGFADIGTSESGVISPFSDYGRTKWDAEEIYKKWQKDDAENRTLVVIRPTVVFGEKNRGNVYNLLKQIASGRFVMVGNGANRKSMAYVENVAAFIEFSLDFKPGIHVYNYVDKPDFTMNSLVSRVRGILGMHEKVFFRLPYVMGLLIGVFFDFLSLVLNKKFSISSIRVKKFCSNSVYQSAVQETGFVPPVNLSDAIQQTVSFEFLENHQVDQLFFSE